MRDSRADLTGRRISSRSGMRDGHFQTASDINGRRNIYKDSFNLYKLEIRNGKEGYGLERLDLREFKIKGFILMKG